MERGVDQTFKGSTSKALTSGAFEQWDTNQSRKNQVDANLGGPIRGNGGKNKEGSQNKPHKKKGGWGKKSKDCPLRGPTCPTKVFEG